MSPEYKKYKKYKRKYKSMAKRLSMQQLGGDDTCPSSGKDGVIMKAIQKEMKRQQGQTQKNTVVNKERKKGEKVVHNCSGTKKNKDGTWSFPSKCKPSSATNAPPQVPYPLGMLPKVFRRDCEPCSTIDKHVCQNNCSMQCNKDPYYMGYCYIKNPMTQMLMQKMNMKMMSGMGGMGMMGMGGMGMM